MRLRYRILFSTSTDCSFHVPARLLSAYEGFSPDEQRTASKASARLRLQVSGSAPLPESLKKRWDGGIGGGQVLLERYGMTETGILLSTGFEIEKRIGVSFVHSYSEFRNAC